MCKKVANSFSFSNMRGQKARGQRLEVRLVRLVRLVGLVGLVGPNVRIKNPHLSLSPLTLTSHH